MGDTITCAIPGREKKRKTSLAAPGLRKRRSRLFRHRRAGKGDRRGKGTLGCTWGKREGRGKGGEEGEGGSLLYLNPPLDHSLSTLQEKKEREGKKERGGHHLHHSPERKRRKKKERRGRKGARGQSSRKGDLPSALLRGGTMEENAVRVEQEREGKELPALERHVGGLARKKKGGKHVL